MQIATVVPPKSHKVNLRGHKMIIEVIKKEQQNSSL